MSHDIAILGAGMHPWGKWGRNFIEYGIVAAQAALKDAGLEWKYTICIGSQYSSMWLSR